MNRRIKEFSTMSAIIKFSSYEKEKQEYHLSDHQGEFSGKGRLDENGKHQGG